MVLNSHWKDGKKETPNIGKDVLWFITIKQDTSQFMTRVYPFWVENTYTVVSSLKNSEDGIYLSLIYTNGSEFKLYVNEDFKTLVDCFWTELPVIDCLEKCN